MTGWQDSNQGELLPNVIHPSNKIRVKTVSPDATISNYFKNNGQYFVLMDNKTEGCNGSKLFFSMINPGQVKSYIDSRESYYEINQFIGSYLHTLNPDNWQIVKSVISQNLVGFAVVPIGIAPS
jgi:hypothetical protein